MYFYSNGGLKGGTCTFTGVIFTLGISTIKYRVGAPLIKCRYVHTCANEHAAVERGLINVMNANRCNSVGCVCRVGECCVVTLVR